MRTVFIDTSHLLALTLNRDAHHEIAIQWQRCFEGCLLTTEYVLVEFVDAMNKGHLRHLASEVVNEPQSDPLVQILSAGQFLFTAGLEMFRHRPDKLWSLTDCISFVAMRQAAIEEAFTTDHHFEQAGFKALLRSPPKA